MQEDEKKYKCDNAGSKTVCLNCKKALTSHVKFESRTCSFGGSSVFVNSIEAAQ